jgi:hypothetical protein
METDSTLKRARRKTLSELVMAWAIDEDTGRPIYIGMLPEDRRAGRCRCRCAACDAPLTGVNVARLDYAIRPHFRHPTDSHKSECSVLAARAAAIELLRTKGELLLPKRFVFVEHKGASGAYYSAAAERPPERIRVRDAALVDRARAKLVLDDGREILVILTGEMTLTDTPEGGKRAAAISIDLRGEELAGLSPDELWSKIQLLADSGCWLSHWKDAELTGQAGSEAIQKADKALDWWTPELGAMHDVPPALRRETLLHLEVKRIVEAAEGIRLPARTVTATLTKKRNAPQASKTIPAEHAALSDVRLERRIARSVPDVLCRAESPNHGRLDPLAIEVTVTNKINAERIERLRTTVQACLEIDLSGMGGQISRESLRDLVLNGLSVKKWLVYPDGPLIWKLHNDEQAREAQKLAQRKEAESRAKRTITDQQENPQQLAKAYLSAAYEFLKSTTTIRVDGYAVDEDIPFNATWRAAERLAQCGFPGGMDSEVLSSTGVLGVVMSLRDGYPISPAYYPMGHLLRFIRNEAPQEHVVTYLIALNCFPQHVGDDDQREMDAWVEEIRRRWKAREKWLARSTRYDKLLGLCFPEMARALQRASKQQASHRER